MSWFRRNDPSEKDWVELWDAMYRIDPEKFRTLLSDSFHVEVVCAQHEFFRDQHRAGASSRVELFGPPKSKIGSRVQSDSDHITVELEYEVCEFRYRSAVQEYFLHFCGDATSLNKWRRLLDRNRVSFGMLFLYLFNRIRGAAAIEEEYSRDRKFIERLIRDLRRESGSGDGLRQVAIHTEFDHVVVFLHAPHTALLVPFACSDASLLRSMDAVRYEQLPHIEQIENGVEGHLEVNLEESVDCRQTCDVMRKRGSRSAVFCRFGSDAATRSEMRGIVAFYRRDVTQISDRVKSIIRHTAREIAAWVDEVDEELETSVYRAAMDLATERCGGIGTDVSSEELFRPLLSDLGDKVGLAISKATQTTEPNPKICFCFQGVQQGELQVPLDELRSSTASDFTMRLGSEESRGQYLLVCEPSSGKKSCIALGGSLHQLSVLRQHVYENLYLLLELVWDLVSVEQRRTAWMQRTIHEVRQPLQGVIAMVGHIRDMAEKPTVTRRQISQYAEDLETSILRMKVLLQIFNNVSCIESIIPNRRPALVEAEVIRPIRRMLNRLAQKRELVIDDPIAVGEIPELNTDPELLSIIFYNLLDNAIKYGYPNSRIRTVCERSEHYFSIEISNKGPEILAHEVSRIFELGFRGSAVRDNEVGLGLGLNMARRIASALDCRLELTERGNDKSTISFCLSIPREQSV